MKNRISLRNLLPHVIAVVGFVLISVIYSAPILSGKRLKMHDIVQAGGAAEEAKKFHEETGEWPAWTNSMFSGMPSFMIAGSYPTSVSSWTGSTLYGLFPVPADIFLISLISGYVLFYILIGNAWLAAFGAIAFTFASFNLVSIEAGHVSKILAVGYAPGILAGILLAFRRNWITGGAVTALFLALELYANHVQITYYLVLSAIGLVLAETIRIVKTGETNKLMLPFIGLALGAILAVSNHTTRLWTNYDYTKETIRGKSELSTPSDGSNNKTDGLDKDYAYYYGSVGIAETFTLLIPNLYGGPSVGTLDANSDTYKVLTSRGVDGSMAAGFVQQLPLYWGEQPISGGPVYAGAIIVFLFVLGLFIVKGGLKWWVAGFTLLFIVWSWGKNFAAINYLFFDYFPLYNKFRSVSMILSLAQMLMVVLAILALKELSSKVGTFKAIQKPFLISLGITAGFCLILSVAPGIFFDFKSTNDEAFVQSLVRSVQDQNFANEIYKGVQSDRAGMLRSDAFRSLFFILIAAAIVWAWLNKKMKPTFVYVSLLFLMTADELGVSKRYLNDQDFVSKQAINSAKEPSPADEQILKDPALSYRVLDQTHGSFMSSADASYLHKSIGGYHGAKIRRYQELIERQLMKQNANQDILNMLNTKYILAPNQQGQPEAHPNPDASGNAWFVKQFKLVDNADAEMNAMDSIKVKELAVVDKKFAPALQGLNIQFDSTNSIKLISYKPDELVYEYQAKSEQLAVFSEIYYNVRDEWQIQIDDKPAQMVRADYVLRGLRVPAGSHKITFKFDPVSLRAGHKVDLVSSILLIALIAAAVWVEIKRKEA